MPSLEWSQSVLPPATPCSIPIPALEQVGDGELEAGQEMFALQQRAGAEQLSIRLRMANFDAFLVGIDDPGNLRPTGEEVLQSLVDFRPRVAGREDFDGQVGRTGKEFARGRGEAEAAQAFFRKEGNVRRATVAVAHPTTQVR